MTRTDFDRFDALMQGVAECYGQTLSARGIALRFKLLERFSLPEVEQAALSVMATRKYTSMPTPADFLEHIGGGSAEDKAEVEAGKVLSAIERHGAYASVVFDDPTTRPLSFRLTAAGPSCARIAALKSRNTGSVKTSPKRGRPMPARA